MFSSTFPCSGMMGFHIPLNPTLSLLNALMLKAAVFLKRVICQHKMEGPCRQISSLSVGSFRLDKENHWHGEALCVACVYVLRLWLLFEPKLEQIFNLREIWWEGACWLHASMCVWQAGANRSSQAEKSPPTMVRNLDLFLQLCIFNLHLLCEFLTEKSIWRR